MRKRWIGVIAVALVALAWWLAGAPGGATRTPGAGPPPGAARSEPSSHPPASGAPAPRLVVARTAGQVVVRGTVIDRATRQIVPRVEVVLRGAGGEATATSDAQGRYQLAVAPGDYRAFVRDDRVLTSGQIVPLRLFGPPRAELAGAPDEGAMPLVAAHRDLHDVDLAVVRAGAIIGTVVDGDGAPVARAIVRARGSARPVLGTDIAEADADGRFALRLPPGHYTLDAAHPRFAGIAAAVELDVSAGDSPTARIVLAAGCVITGKVVDAEDRPAAEGALEVNRSLFDPPALPFGSAAGRSGAAAGDDDLAFMPAGRIEPDGTFRFATGADTEVTLRAWPWKSPPSPSRIFHCRQGARFTDVVFRLPERASAVDGVIVDAAGAPVPFAFLDIVPQDPLGVGQVERSDADGKWAIYNLPAGNYKLVASAPGLGVALQALISPSTGVRIALSGTGRIEGTTTAMVDGGFEARFISCDDRPAAPDVRLVTVTGGRFAIDGVPACRLGFTARTATRSVNAAAAVIANDTTHVELDLGEPRAKTVHGVIRDREGPVAGARVTALADAHAATVRADASGRYTIETYAGAQLVAGDGARVVNAVVGHADVPDEQIDLVVGQ